MTQRTVFLLGFLTLFATAALSQSVDKSTPQSAARFSANRIVAATSGVAGDSLRKALRGAPQNLAFRPFRTMDVVAGEVFLQGNFIEVGIHGSGSFGTEAAAPEGFHPLLSGGGRQLGFVVDPGQDGWDVGTPPQSGDYFVPGAPEEGWAVEWTVAGSERTFGNFGLEGDFDVPQTSLVETSSGDTRSAVWEGTAVNGDEKLRITQTVTFDVTDLFFVINVVMTNVGTVPLESLEYMRNVDPDQEQPLTDDFTTSNFVAFQPERSGHPTRPDIPARPAGNTEKALVVATGLEFGITLGLGTIDPRAVVSAEGFSNRDPDDILDTPIQPLEGIPSIEDEAIALAFDLGTLAPGQSASIDYAYILNASDLEVALGQLAAVTILQPTGTVSGSNVLFQATTNDVPNTLQIEFFVNDVSIGVDTTPDGGGVFERTFDSLTLPNGPANLKAVATFADESTAEKTTSVTVDNSGPPMGFITPTPGQSFSTDGIPIEIEVLDPGQPPVRVSFFRETASTGSLFLGEDTSEPFTSAFDVSDLPDGETVVIKAVGTDALDRTTTIQVSGTVVFNDPPVAVNDTTSTPEDTSATIDVVANDTDPDNDPLTIAEITQAPANGNAVIEPGATEVTYTPDPNFNGGDSFEYSVTDGEFSDTAKVIITVDPRNDPPTAVDDTVETAVDTPVTVDVLANDSDVENDPLTVILVTPGQNGVASIGGADRTVIYTPNSGFSGQDTVTYTISDGNGGEDSARILITVIPTNQPPVAVNDTVSTDEDTPISIPVLANDSDPDNDPLTVTRVTQGANGTVVIDPGSASVTYRPNADFNGEDSFEYSISDGQFADTARVVVTVDPVNDPPVAVNDDAVTDEDMPVVIPVVRNDTDVDGDPLNIMEVGQGTNGSVAINTGGGDLATLSVGDTTVTYTPNPDFHGEDAFTYIVSDGNGGTDTASVAVTVTPVNDAPTAVNDTVTTEEDSPVTIQVLANDLDVDGDGLSISEVSQGAHGTVVIGGGDQQGNQISVATGDTTVTYTPDADFNGEDSFTYVTTDGQGGVDTAQVNITVAPVNDPPVAANDTTETDQGSPVTVAVLQNDTDVEGDPLTVGSVTQGGHGTVAMKSGDTTVTYTPDPDFSGLDSFTYTADDGNGGIDTASVRVVVRDRRAPGPPINLTVFPAGWTNANPVIIRWQNPPDSSGIGGLKFTIDTPPTSNEDGIFVPGVGIDSVAVPMGPELRGTHTAYIWLVDGDGNSDFMNTGMVTVQYDDVPPTTVDDVHPTGWYNGDAKVKLTATDSLSGVAATYFKVDGGQTQQGTRPTIRGEGRNHTLEYWSTDHAGNTEPVKSSRPIHIDLTPPAGEATSAVVTAEGKIEVGWEASDNLSGVFHVELWFRKDFSFWIRQIETYGSSPIEFVPTFGEGTYGFIVTPVDSAGNVESRGDTAEVSVVYSTTGVGHAGEVPAEYMLEQNYPNPFNPRTVIRYGLPEDSEVRLEVYNLLGQRVRTLVSGRQVAGTYGVEWVGRSAAGRPLPSGVYVVRLQAGEFVAVRKMLLVE